MSSGQREFSLFSLFTAGLACVLPLVNAYTQPVGAEPSGNPIYQPGLNSIVPAGENFTVTWDPTTQGTVTLVLLKGPSTNAVPQYAIVEKIPNSGSYIWLPSTELAPATTGYGIQLIVDATGQYQYTTQFGISNPNYNPNAVSTTSAVVSTTSASVTISAYATASTSTKSASTTDTCSETITSNSSTTASVYITKPYPTTSAGALTHSLLASTGGVPANGSIVYPTGSMTVPSSLVSTTHSTGRPANATSSSTAPIQPVNAASGMAASIVGLVVAAGIAVLAV